MLTGEGAATRIANYFEGPSFERGRRAYQSLSLEDRDRQSYVIQISLRARVAAKGADQVPVAAPDQLVVANAAKQFLLREWGTASSPDALLTLTGGQPWRDSFVADALSIGNKLRADAFCGDDGSATWMGPQYIPEAERHQLSVLTFSFYDGTTGVGLLLAALARITGDETWRKLALAAFHSIREGLKKEFDELVRLSGIGGTSGVTCALYALVRSGQWLDDESLVEEARAAAWKLTREQIQADHVFDIISGSAGAILCLLAVHEATADAVVLERCAGLR